MFNKTFRKSALLAGSSALALSVAVAGAAQSQDTVSDDDDVEEIVVTGIRASIEDSLRMKRQSNSIVEAISAEDIGKLPDVSIADSLARLPGVTAQRVRGRAQQISIRGLGPDFSIALLNGREQVSAGNNRGIEFDQFPSELINTGVVYKTPDATLAATGVAGAVDLRTVRPLDYQNMRLNASAKYVINDNGKVNPDFSNKGYRLFGSYIDQNDDGTVGWSIGVTHQSNPTQYISRELKTNQFQTAQTPGGTYYPADNPRSGAVSRDFKRTSIAGALQFEPSERFGLTIDGFYSDFEDQGIFRGVETPIASWSGASVTDVSGSGTFADSATYDNVGVFLRTDTEANTAEIFSFGVNTFYQVSDRLKVTLDYSRSELDKSDIDYESYAGKASFILGSGDPTVLDTLTYTFPGNGQYTISPRLDYSTPGSVVLADPGGWGQVGFIKEPSIDDELEQIRAEAEYDLGTDIIDSIVVGALRTDRIKSFNSRENFIRVGSAFTNSEAPIPAGTVVGVTDSGSLGLNIVAYDPSSFLTDGTYVLEAANSVTWTVEEEITTLYAMANIDTDIGIPVRGNIGLQYVDVEQSSTGTLSGAGTQTLGDSYDHWLPSLNLSFEVAEDTFIRVAAAKTVTRPRLDQMTANQSLTVNNAVCADTLDANGDFVGAPGYAGPGPDGVVDTLVNLAPENGRSCFNYGGGNPELKPYESTSFDIAFEKYFGTDTAIALAFFHKDVDNWVVDQSIVQDATQPITQAGFGDILTAFPGTEQVGLGSSVNFESAKISGIEATVRAGLDRFLPFEGMGIEASYTYADASLADSNDNVIPIPGYSENIWSGAVYYDHAGWRGKLSARHRSGFLSEIALFDGSLSGANALGETILDAQIGYEFESGALEGFSFNIEAYNITNEPFRTVNDLDGPNNGGTDTFVSRYEQYGRTFSFTIAKSF